MSAWAWKQKCCPAHRLRSRFKTNYRANHTNVLLLLYVNHIQMKLIGAQLDCQIHLCFIDDVITFNPTLEQHLIDSRKTITKIQQTPFSLPITKCQHLQRTSNYSHLGQLVVTIIAKA